MPWTVAMDRCVRTRGSTGSGTGLFDGSFPVPRSAVCGDGPLTSTPTSITLGSAHSRRRVRCMASRINLRTRPWLPKGMGGRQHLAPSTVPQGSQMTCKSAAAGRLKTAAVIGERTRQFTASTLLGTMPTSICIRPDTSTPLMWPLSM